MKTEKAPKNFFPLLHFKYHRYYSLFFFLPSPYFSILDLCTCNALKELFLAQLCPFFLKDFCSEKRKEYRYIIYKSCAGLISQELERRRKILPFLFFLSLSPFFLGFFFFLLWYGRASCSRIAYYSHHCRKRKKQMYTSAEQKKKLYEIHACHVRNNIGGEKRVEQQQFNNVSTAYNTEYLYFLYQVTQPPSSHVPFFFSGVVIIHTPYVLTEGSMQAAWNNISLYKIFTLSLSLLKMQQQRSSVQTRVHKRAGLIMVGIFWTQCVFTISSKETIKFYLLM